MRNHHHHINGSNSARRGGRRSGLALHRKWLSFRVLEGRAQARLQPDQMRQRPAAHAALAVVVAVVVVACGLNDMPFKGSVHLRGIAQAGFCVIAAAMYGVHMLMAYAQSAVRSCVGEHGGGGSYSVWGRRRAVHHACDDDDAHDDDADDDDYYHDGGDGEEEDKEEDDRRHNNPTTATATATTATTTTKPPPHDYGDVAEEEEEEAAYHDRDDHDEAAAPSAAGGVSIPLLLRGGPGDRTPQQQRLASSKRRSASSSSSTTGNMMDSSGSAEDAGGGPLRVGLPREVVISSMYLGGTGTFLAVAPLCMWDCAVTLAFLLSLMLIALLDAPRHTRRTRLYWVLVVGVLLALGLAIAIEFASRVPQIGSLSLLAEYVRAHPLFAFTLTTELPSASASALPPAAAAAAAPTRRAGDLLLDTTTDMGVADDNDAAATRINQSMLIRFPTARPQLMRPRRPFVTVEAVPPDADTEAALMLAQAGAPSLWPFMLLAAVSPLLLRAGGGGVLAGGLYHTMSPSQTLETGIPVNGLLAGLVLSWFSPLENALVHTHALVNRGNCLVMLLVAPPALAATLALLLHSLRCRTSLVSVTVLTFAVMVRQQCSRDSNSSNLQHAGGAALDVIGLCVASLCLLLALWLVCRTGDGLVAPMIIVGGGRGGAADDPKRQSP